MINIGDLLARRARLSPDREAYVDALSGERLTFMALHQRANQAARLLSSLGVRRGDRVALLLSNSPELVELFFAMARIGAICVPLNWRLAAAELDVMLRDSGCRALVYEDTFSEITDDLKSRDRCGAVNPWLRVHRREDDRAAPSGPGYAGLRDACDPTGLDCVGGGDDVLFIMYTSGTTGIPKGVVHTHNTCFWAVLTFAATHDLRDSDRYLAALPMFHVGSLTPVTVNIYRGATSVVMRSFDSAQAWRIIEKERVTTGLLVPAMLNFMMQSPARAEVDFSSVRWIQAGAAPVPVKLIQDFKNIGIDVHQIYGLTETCGPACVIDPEHALEKIGSTGKAFFHTEVRVMDESGQVCAPNQPGEVWIRGPHIMTGYWNQPRATAEVLRDGWLRTGDGAIQDEDGYFFVRDRIKDMLISGGENVYPAEIENVLLSHPQIAEVAVIGLPSARWGESPLAIVVRKTGTLTEDDVLRHCDGMLARYKRPCGVIFVDSIPRNPSGKILKRVLRQRYPGPAPV